MEAVLKEVRLFRTKLGRIPFMEWLQALPDLRARQKIQARIDRVSLGDLGDAKSVGEGIHELKINFGPGYRLYCGFDGDAVVILVLGGTKGTQNEDIQKAKAFWSEYKNEKNYGKR